MAFRFALESVLRVRRGQEQAERLKLEAIVLEIRQAHARIQQALEYSAGARLKFQQELAVGLSGSEVQFQAATEVNMALRLARLKDQLAQLEQNRLEQIKVFHEFRQRREILEHLRERQLAIHSAQMSRREQQNLDDIFLMRELMRDPFD